MGHKPERGAEQAGEEAAMREDIVEISVGNAPADLGLDKRAIDPREDHDVDKGYHQQERGRYTGADDAPDGMVTLDPVGQGTVALAPEPAPAGNYAVIVIRDRKSGAGLKYVIGLDSSARCCRGTRSRL